MSDDSADKRAVGAHPESFSGRAHPGWTSWTQADPDSTCFRSCIVDTQHRRAVGTCCRKAIRTTNPFIGAFKQMIEAKPENLIGDRAYDSDPLDEELRKDGIEMIAPHRSNRSKPPTQD